MFPFRRLITIICLLVMIGIASTGEAAAQSRTRGVLTLRAKPHTVDYIGVLQVVGEVGGQEQYRVGPDTVGLSINVRMDDGDDGSAEYSLDLGEGSAAEGAIDFSSLGINSDQWRPALEALTLVSFFPLPEGEVTEGLEWAELVSYNIAEIDLDFAEATQFRVTKIDDGLATITFSGQGGGSTSIARPMLGPDAKMDITRESAREGSFVFSIAGGYVISSERIERTTTESTVFVGDQAQAGPTETQTVTFRLGTLPGGDQP